jgi:hypothetical protein
MSPQNNSKGNGYGHGSSTSPSTTYSPSISRSISQTPNIPLTLPRWGGPPPPPLPHHPHSNSTWNRSGTDSDSASGSGSISLAKITGPPNTRTTSDFYKRDPDPLNEYTHHSSASSGNIGKISQYQSTYQVQGGQGQGNRVGGYEREVSEDPGSSKKRRRDSEKPSLEEMDDRCTFSSSTSKARINDQTPCNHLCTLSNEKD